MQSDAQRLCPAHLAQAASRIYALCERNPGWSVEEWERFWAKEAERQERTMREHCGRG